MSASDSCFAAGVAAGVVSTLGAVWLAYRLQQRRASSAPRSLLPLLPAPDPALEKANIKMKYIVRSDLGMTKGKIAAQCGHATMGLIEKLLGQPNTRWLQWLSSWNANGVAKIALRVESEEALLDIKRKAQAAGVPFATVRDAGHTQVAPNSLTVLGLGPAPASALSFTDKLPLL
eukprot:TRINITY_DN34453_c0_g1_i1.p1 TRINITY_DN34453_c0_g1~~TRINITY_DN34453_c0_g1_i1.p1  ORF type:complete len:175 (+),score=11.80 TRINITY_DN34453_c0_g1_i1:118-642(+)